MAYRQIRIYLENKTHNIFCYSEIQTNPPIQSRRPVLIIINKQNKIYCIVDFAVPADHRVKVKEGKRLDKFMDRVRHRKAVKPESDCNTIRI